MRAEKPYRENLRENKKSFKISSAAEDPNSDCLIQCGCFTDPLIHRFTDSLVGTHRLTDSDSLVLTH